MAKNSTWSSLLEPKWPGPKKAPESDLHHPPALRFVLLVSLVSGRRTLHLATRRCACDVGLEVLHRRKGVAGVLHVVLVLGIDLLPLGDPEALLHLVVGLAHLGFAVEALELQALQR